MSVDTSVIVLNFALVTTAFLLSPVISSEIEFPLSSVPLIVNLTVESSPALVIFMLMASLLTTSLPPPDLSDDKEPSMDIAPAFVTEASLNTPSAVLSSTLTKLEASFASPYSVTPASTLSAVFLSTLISVISLNKFFPKAVLLSVPLIVSVRSFPSLSLPLQ